MMLGYVTGGGQGAGDALLADVAKALADRGVVLAGAVQENREPGDGTACDMDLRVLVGERVISISQNLGALSEGCRLDPGGLEHAVGLVDAALAGEGPQRPQLLIVNKFGKQEADGRGFRPAIGRALAQGIPVLTAVSPSQQEAFAAFSGDFAEPLAAEAEAVTGWALAAIAAGPSPDQ